MKSGSEAPRSGIDLRAEVLVYGRIFPITLRPARPGAGRPVRGDADRRDGLGRLSLPRVLGPDGFAIEQIEDPAGRPLDLALDARAGSIVVPKLAEGLARSNGPLWLEYRRRGGSGWSSSPARRSRPTAR